VNGSVSDAADKSGEMTAAPDADLPEGPDTDVFVVRAASAPERVINSDRGGDHVFRSSPRPWRQPAATRSFTMTFRSAVGRCRMSIRKRMSGSTCYTAIPSSMSMTARSHLPRATSCTFPWAPPIGFEVFDAPVRVLAGYCPAGEELAFL
jgi:hypothetical protein